MNTPIIDQINIIIDSCNASIELNLKRIKSNLKLIEEIKSEIPSSITYNKLIKLYAENDSIHNFNKNSILLQSNLLGLVKSMNEIIDSLPLDKIKGLLEKFNGTTSFEIEGIEVNQFIDDSNVIDTRKYSEDEIFWKTIEKKMEFDSNHPFFKNYNFTNKLVKYYEAVEDYEMCTKITKQKMK